MLKSIMTPQQYILLIHYGVLMEKNSNSANRVVIFPQKELSIVHLGLLTDI